MTSTASTAAAPREWRLAARPTGWPTPEDFELATSVLPELADGQIRVRNEVLSVDPYMRGRMSAAKPRSTDGLVEDGLIGLAG
jgi:NADPH-dependent curcumin reductase CurA